MTRLVLSPRALLDVERLTDFLIEQDPAAARTTMGILIDGLRILEDHPLIGRPAEHDLRELIVSRGRTGYVALYKFDVKGDVALILAIRHQREGGYAD